MCHVRIGVIRHNPTILITGLQEASATLHVLVKKGALQLMVTKQQSDARDHMLDDWMEFVPFL